MGRVAVLDIGTVTCRLGIADVADGKVVRLGKTSTICNLGQDVAKTGKLAPEAIERVQACINQYLETAYAAGVRVACCTLTSAARDASNADALISGLQKQGIAAQVISGDTEGSLTFLGVAQDFVNTRICVADNGGGSTEIAMGTLEVSGSESKLNLEAVHSINLGCRRLTDMFLQRDDPPCADALEEAHAYCADVFSRELPQPARNLGETVPLVCVGGTATTLVAINAGLDPYDPAYVHLHTLNLSEVNKLTEQLAAKPLDQRRATKGLQPKRAEVIVGGSICVSELMSACGVEHLTTSESDLLFGLALVADAVSCGNTSPIGWKPQLFALM